MPNEPDYTDTPPPSPNGPRFVRDEADRWLRSVTATIMDAAERMVTFSGSMSSFQPIPQMTSADLLTFEAPTFTTSLRVYRPSNGRGGNARDRRRFRRANRTLDDLLASIPHPLEYFHAP